METDCEEVRGGEGYHSDPLTSNVPMYFDAACDCLHQTRLIAYQAVLVQNNTHC